MQDPNRLRDALEGVHSARAAFERARTGQGQLEDALRAQRRFEREHDVSSVEFAKENIAIAGKRMREGEEQRQRQEDLSSRTAVAVELIAAEFLKGQADQKRALRWSMIAGVTGIVSVLIAVVALFK